MLRRRPGPGPGPPPPSHWSRAATRPAVAEATSVKRARPSPRPGEEGWTDRWHEEDRERIEDDEEEEAKDKDDGTVGELDDEKDANAKLVGASPTTSCPAPCAL